MKSTAKHADVYVHLTSLLHPVTRYLKVSKISNKNLPNNYGLRFKGRFLLMYWNLIPFSLSRFNTD